MSVVYFCMVQSPNKLNVGQIASECNVYYIFFSTRIFISIYRGVCSLSALLLIAVILYL